jgi:hypothetical protein
MTSDESRLELATMIEALRDSLDKAQADGRDRETKFGVEAIEIEATVEVEKERGIGGGVKFWVIQAGGGISGSSIATQRIRLSLSTDPSLRISRPRPREGDLE